MGLRRLTVLLTVVALLAVACSTDDTDGGLGADSYLDEVRRIEQGREEAVDTVIDALDQAYQTRPRFFQVFEAALEGERVSAALEEARGLDAPPELRAAHRRWIESLEASLAFEKPAREAIDNDDFAALALAIADFATNFLSFVVDVPPGMCEVVTPESLASTEALCRPGDDLPGREYGERLRSAAQVMPVQIGPRISGLQVAFTDEERLAYLDAIQPDVERLFAQTISDIESLDPPDELRADHEAVLTFFRDLLAVAEEITAATAAGDIDRLSELFTESERPAQQLESSVSDDGRRIVGPVLLEQ